jgi:hypothetical protein
VAAVPSTGKASIARRLRDRLKARRERRTERARVVSDVQRERERRGEVGRYGVGDNTGYGGPGI